MHQTSDLYKQILVLPHRVESRLLIQGREYNRSHITALSTRGYAFKEESPSVGNVCSSSIDLEMLSPDNVIPVQERMVLQSRIVSGDKVSEWIQKGEFWVQTRKTEITRDGTPTTIQIYGCDAIMRSEQDYVPSGEWPKTDATVLSEICSMMGVTCNEHLGAGYLIDYPESYTCREILGYIGAMYGGNWFMAEDGQLILLKLGTNRGQSSVKPSMLYTGDPLPPITRVVLHKMDGNKFYADAGGNGRTLNVDCPWATQGMADAIFNQVRGYVYRPFSAEQAITNPAQEIGDDVGLGIIYQYSTEFFDGMITDVSAPPEEEIAHDYPYKSGGGGMGGRAMDAARKNKEDTKSLIAKVDLAEAGILASVKYVDLEDGEWVHANTSIFAQAGGKRAAFDIWVEGISSGQIDSAATLVADNIYLRGKKIALDALSTSTSGSLNVGADLRVAAGHDIWAPEGQIVGNELAASTKVTVQEREFTPKTITSFFTPDHKPIEKLYVLGSA